MNPKPYIAQKRALALRNSQTDAEKIVWSFVRRHGLGLKFKRQQPIDSYIVDFVCFEKRLIIEIDGGQHTAEKDKKRTEHLERSGFTILRFWNNDVIENKEGVYFAIEQALNAPSP